MDSYTKMMANKRDWWLNLWWISRNSLRNNPTTLAQIHHEGLYTVDSKESEYMLISTYMYLSMILIVINISTQADNTMYVSTGFVKIIQFTTKSIQ